MKEKKQYHYKTYIYILSLLFSHTLYLQVWILNIFNCTVSIIYTVLQNCILLQLIIKFYSARFYMYIKSLLVFFLPFSYFVSQIYKVFAKYIEALHLNLKIKLNTQIDFPYVYKRPKSITSVRWELQCNCHNSDLSALRDHLQKYLDNQVYCKIDLKRYNKDSVLQKINGQLYSKY